MTALAPVRGISALALSGSRARGTAVAESDYDFGVYYEPNVLLAVDDLRAALAALADAGEQLTVTETGAWGPWINGGAWARIGGHNVDLLYRDLGRVRAVIADCMAGVTEMHYGPGHPHGFCSAAWLGEIALCVPLRDDAGALARLQKRALPYPERLAHALIARFHWEVRFSIENAEQASQCGERTHVAGCAYRALACVAQVVFAANGRYLIDEKGALAEAASFPNTIARANQTADRIWGAIGRSDFELAFSLLRTMLTELDGVVARHRG